MPTSFRAVKYLCCGLLLIPYRESLRFTMLISYIHVENAGIEYIFVAFFHGFGASAATPCFAVLLSSVTFSG